MPNPDNSGWMSLLFGRPMAAPRRRTIQDLIDSRHMWDLSHLLTDLPVMAEVYERVVLRRRDDVELWLEVYVPPGSGPFPLHLNIHGGGFSAGSAKNDRKLAMRFAEQGFVTLNVEYGLAPEHPFPWALEDCIYAARWAIRNAARYGGDARSLSIGGSSAGANLAAATILAVAGGPAGYDLDEGDLAGVEVTFSAAVLFYGIFSFPLLLTEPGSNVGPAELWNISYLGMNFTRLGRHPLVSPVFATNLRCFPPTYISCGDQDSLLGHSLEMGKMLALANVPTTVSVIERADHSFALVPDRVPGGEAELLRCFRWLRERAGTPPSAALAPSS